MVWQTALGVLEWGRGHTEFGPLSHMNMVSLKTAVAQEVSMSYTSTPPAPYAAFLPSETVCMSSLSVHLSAVNDTRW